MRLIVAACFMMLLAATLVAQEPQPAPTVPEVAFRAEWQMQPGSNAVALGWVASREK